MGTATNRSRNHPSPLNPPNQYLNLQPCLPSLQSQQRLPSLLYKLKLPHGLRPPPILYRRPPPRLQGDVFKDDLDSEDEEEVVYQQISKVMDKKMVHKGVQMRELRQNDLVHNLALAVVDK